MKNPICVAPWMSASITPIGLIKPCCVYRGNLGTIHNTTLDEAWNNPAWSTLRRSMYADSYPPECVKCQKGVELMEDARSDWYINRLKEFSISPEEAVATKTIRHLDLNFSNQCNLQCRMCHSMSSAVWSKDDKFLEENHPEFERLSVGKVDGSAQNWNIPGLLSDVVRIDIKGGEPMMQEEHFDFLEWLIEQGYAPNIRLCYVTNGTVRNGRAEELWPHFKKIHITFSIDGLDQVAKYIRTVNFEQFKENLYYYDELADTLNDVEYKWTTTVQIYNILYLNDILNFIRSHDLRHFNRTVGLNFVLIPAYLSVFMLPMEIKRHACELLTDDVFAAFKKNLLTTMHDPVEWAKFKKFTSIMDNRNDIRMADCLPELTKLITHTEQFDKYKSG